MLHLVPKRRSAAGILGAAITAAGVAFIVNRRTLMQADEQPNRGPSSIARPNERLSWLADALPRISADLAAARRDNVALRRENALLRRRLRTSQPTQVPQRGASVPHVSPDDIAR
jgi:hypothetical protein